MMIRKIYLDMDGVLSDFERRYREVFGTDPALVRAHKEFSENWKQFVEEHHFNCLDYYEGALELLEYLADKDVEIEILSSSGGERYHNIVEQDKILWLRERGIPYYPNIVSGRSKKKNFAEADTLLIDDHADNIRQFVEAGGQGIYHKDIRETIAELERLLNA
jgi:FMN phosphatase YigB (HAD superfamily)